MADDLVVRDKMAPVQGYSAGIPWAMHLRAYDAYCKMYGEQPALIEGGCRGGFHDRELDDFIPGWREELLEINQLKTQLAAMTAERDYYRKRAFSVDGLERRLTAAEAALEKALPPLEHMLASVIPSDASPEIAAAVCETLAYKTFKDRVDSIRAALGETTAPVDRNTGWDAKL